jgi:hypothetical protein
MTGVAEAQNDRGAETPLSVTITMSVAAGLKIQRLRSFAGPISGRFEQQAGLQIPQEYFHSLNIDPEEWKDRGGPKIIYDGVNFALLSRPVWLRFHDAGGGTQPNASLNNKKIATCENHCFAGGRP